MKLQANSTHRLQLPLKPHLASGGLLFIEENRNIFRLAAANSKSQLPPSAIAYLGLSESADF
jgi:hypothetical protein